MHYTTFVKTGFTLTLAGIAVLGGIQGNALAAQNAADLKAEQRVTAQMVDARNLQNAYVAGEAQKTLADFQPTLDAATALVTESDGKASAESRAALANLVSEFETKVAASFTTPVAYRDAAETATVTGATAIATASQVVTDEVAAWQAAEDARIAAEQAAAEEAARNSSGGGYRNGGGGGDSGGDGGSNNGGSSDGRAWAEGIVWSIAPNVSSIVWDYTPVAGSYGGMHKGGVVYLSNSVADGSGYAYSILVHEATHAGPQRGSCYDTWKGHFGGDAERFTQAYTLANFGTTVGAYSHPTDADLAAAGSC